MIESWRWFGPDDPVTLTDIRQAGATAVVTALHHLPNGTVWPREEIRTRKDMIEAAGLHWNVVESIPVHEDIKTGAEGWQDKSDAWAETVENLAQEGIRTICYNFMPVRDWTRTELDYRRPDGTSCLRFDMIDLAVFDLHVLKRAKAADEFGPDIAALAAKRSAEMDDAMRERLAVTILAGLPGAEESYSLESFRAQIARYHNIGRKELRARLASFLARVMPRVEAAGARIAIHPDDPPRSLFGLPNVVSTTRDFKALAEMWPGRANGITFCTGSLAALEENDLTEMISKFQDRIHFLHLRSIQREEDGVSFREVGHLAGDVNMVAIISEVHKIETLRKEDLPMRPDHGNAIVCDLHNDFRPGYPLIGRLRGLAELRGIVHALEWVDHHPFARRHPSGEGHQTRFQHR